ncbi:MAG: hypothetical protein E7000_03175 [Coriobacteriaceae bacterium]|nr:hypothetical protein [Coriobacteriaceae bacterium]
MLVQRIALALALELGELARVVGGAFARNLLKPEHLLADAVHAPLQIFQNAQVVRHIGFHRREIALVVLLGGQLLVGLQLRAEHLDRLEVAVPVARVQVAPAMLVRVPDVHDVVDFALGKRAPALERELGQAVPQHEREVLEVEVLEVRVVRRAVIARCRRVLLDGGLHEPLAPRFRVERLELPAQERADDLARRLDLVVDALGVARVALSDLRQAPVKPFLCFLELAISAVACHTRPLPASFPPSLWPIDPANAPATWRKARRRTVRRGRGAGVLHQFVRLAGIGHRMRPRRFSANVQVAQSRPQMRKTIYRGLSYNRRKAVHGEVRSQRG